METYNRLPAFLYFLLFSTILLCGIIVYNNQVKPSLNNDYNCPSYVYGQQAKETLMTTLPYQEKACNTLGGQPAIFTIHQVDINAPLVIFMCLKDINN